MENKSNLGLTPTDRRRKRALAANPEMPGTSETETQGGRWLESFGPPGIRGLTQPWQTVQAQLRRSAMFIATGPHIHPFKPCKAAQNPTDGGMSPLRGSEKSF